MNTKKTIAVLLVVAMMLCLASCSKYKVGSKDDGNGGGADSVAESVVLTLAAAASLKNAFENDLIPAFSKQYPGITIQGTYDSSGKLQTQIEEGLEADIFFSAAVKQMNALEEKGLIDSASRKELLENKIVLIISDDENADDGKFHQFTDIVKADMIAIGDPESVPAGQYAKEALTSLGIWDEVSAKVSLGTNVTEVLNWVAEGSAEAGIVYATDAASQPKAKAVAEAPEGTLEKPVIYPVAIVKASAHHDAAEKMMKFLGTDEATKIFEKYGFTVRN
ncbi:MAG: molybdate ABC transporter substrate-binding protein [Lachnospiraceae bacterium]|nr:molybdate ABC transporter substrate-binding protein [Lachnospiraceae bacterium]